MNNDYNNNDETALNQLFADVTADSNHTLESKTETKAKANGDEATEASADAIGEGEAVKPVVKTKSTGKPKRSANYRAKAEHDQAESYTISEGIAQARANNLAKFDASLDLHIRLVPAKKGDDLVRGLVNLPHGTGKDRKVAIITDEIIEKIEKGWLDFDVAVATPAMMPKLSKLAKILGPRGLMPNPKAGTVTEDPEKVAAELKSGRVEYKADSSSNIHQPIGRLSFADSQLIANIETFIAALPASKIQAVHLAPTMGRAVKLQV
ncbi:MAG: large subunit ribosomal protein L1 [Candidatus Berkelbacteria bacterium Gr01-1014_85]|uniref:Ribosomal protein n=1 Tax=Candidatus Berkelbacteria bacterium Gr01-1014_85 TaxID=2017150 RepID=A0A554JCT7_9BACT|nr:MAG: large subunit ribosomal protein L1 [Candidatus Berkelbacteria bacterium Gr01-1014_85]